MRKLRGLGECEAEVLLTFIVGFRLRGLAQAFEGSPKALRVITCESLPNWWGVFAARRDRGVERNQE